MPAIITSGTYGPQERFIGKVQAIVRLHKSGCYGSADVAMHDIGVALKSLEEEEERARNEERK